MNCSADLLFYWLRFNQKSKSADLANPMGPLINVIMKVFILKTNLQSFVGHRPAKTNTRQLVTAQLAERLLLLHSRGPHFKCCKFL